MNKLETLKELMALIGDDESTKKETVASHLVGRVCMFRTYSAGVHFGELAAKNGQECLVKNARRVWYWSEAATLSQLSCEGSKKLDDCKIAMKVKEIVLDQVIEVIPMTKDACAHLYGAEEWKQ